MNNQLIEKVIRSNDSIACPEFSSTNALIDRNVAGALARSFVKMFTVAQQDSNINNNIRHAVLSNIRKICSAEPENHIEIDEDLTETLSEVYMAKITSQDVQNERTTERSLDEFLMRNMNDFDINSNHQTSFNPDVIQALVNLNQNNTKLSSITKNVLHWNVSDKKCRNLVKDLWTNTSENSLNLGDLSIKNKAEIEIILIKSCLNLLTDNNTKTEELFTQEILRDLVKKCSISAECFQICIRVLNSLFVQTNFNIKVQQFISQFIVKIREQCTISVLYPAHLRHVSILLDIDLEMLSNQLKNKYVKDTVLHLKCLHKKSEADLILLLSHYPQWFDIYFDTKM